jgi:hypothetical protein
MLCDRKDISGGVYIGETQFAHQTIARIRPIAAARDGYWYTIADPEHPFPSEGLVFSVDPKVRGRERGHIVLFTAHENDRPDADQKKDRFITTEVCEPYEILERLEGLSLDELRNKLVIEGFDRGLQQNERVVVPLPGNHYALPRVVRHRSSPGWCLAHDENLAAIPLFEGTPKMAERIRIDGRAFAIPGSIRGAQVGVVNWQLESDFLETLLKYLKKTAPLQPGGELDALSQNVRQRLLTAYRDAEILSDNAFENNALRERLVGFLKRSDAGSDAIRDIAEELLTSPLVREELTRLSQDAVEEAKQDAIARIRDEMRTQIEEEFRELDSRRDVVLQEVIELEASREEIKTEIERLQAKQGEDRAELEATIDSFRSKTGDVAESVGRIIEGMRTFGLDVPIAPVYPGRSDNGQETASPPWSRVLARPTPLIRLEDLHDHAQRASQRAGIEIESFMQVDVLLRSGAVPIVKGPAAENLINCYCATVAGGSPTRTPLDPTVLSADDLWRHPARSGPTAFAEVWLRAEADPNILHAACLDDIDLASLSGWFPRFALLFQHSRPENLVVFATVSGTKSPADDVTPAPRVTAEFAPGALGALIMAREPEMSRLESPFLRRPSDDERNLLWERVMDEFDRPVIAQTIARYFSASLAWFDDFDEAFSFCLALLRLQDADESLGASPTRLRAAT